MRSNCSLPMQSLIIKSPDEHHSTAHYVDQEEIWSTIAMNFHDKTHHFFNMQFSMMFTAHVTSHHIYGARVCMKASSNLL